MYLVIAKVDDIQGTRTGAVNTQKVYSIRPHSIVLSLLYSGQSRPKFVSLVIPLTGRVQFTDELRHSVEDFNRKM